MRASLRSDWPRRLLSVVALLAAVHSTSRAENLPIVVDVEFQPLSAQVKRVIEALEMLGQPLDRRREGPARARPSIPRAASRRSARSRMFWTITA